MPPVMLATLALNEMEWLPKLYKQHKDWPNLIQWVFVESADRMYTQAHPELVSPSGLSIDGTTDFLADLARSDSRVIHIPYGFCSHPDPALGKVTARQQYLDAAEKIRPEFIIVLDADEFYCKGDQALMSGLLKIGNREIRHFCFQFTHIWHTPHMANLPLFSYEITGGFWDMRHAKGIRWSPGLRYCRHHQRPENRDGYGRMVYLEQPHCIHMAFASNPTLRLAKHDYYVERGEGKGDGRQSYVVSRNLYRCWYPGFLARLPPGVSIHKYEGPIPEVFVDEHY
jgi:hypothetical protein